MDCWVELDGMNPHEHVAGGGLVVGQVHVVTRATMPVRLGPLWLGINPNYLSTGFVDGFQVPHISHHVYTFVRNLKSLWFSASLLKKWWKVGCLVRIPSLHCLICKFHLGCCALEGPCGVQDLILILIERCLSSSISN